MKFLISFQHIDWRAITGFLLAFNPTAVAHLGSVIQVLASLGGLVLIGISIYTRILEMRYRQRRNDLNK